LTVAPGIVIPTIVVTESSTAAGRPVDVLDDPDGGLDGGLDGGFAGGCVDVGGGVWGLGGDVCCDGGGVCGFGGGVVWVGGGVVCGDNASHSTSREHVSML
jgi:hypothetical protein